MTETYILNKNKPKTFKAAGPLLVIVALTRMAMLCTAFHCCLQQVPACCGSTFEHFLVRFPSIRCQGVRASEEDARGRAEEEDHAEWRSAVHPGRQSVSAVAQQPGSHVSVRRVRAICVLRYATINPIPTLACAAISTRATLVLFCFVFFHRRLFHWLSSNFHL